MQAKCTKTVTLAQTPGHCRPGIERKTSKETREEKKKRREKEKRERKERRETIYELSIASP